MARIVHSGYFGNWFLRLHDDGTLEIGIPKKPGYWDVITVDLTPGDGGTFGLTTFNRTSQFNWLSEQPPRTASGPGRALPGAPPNARLVDVLRARNESSTVANAPDPLRDPGTDATEEAI